MTPSAETHRRATLQTYGFALVLVSLGLAVGLSLSQSIATGWGILAALALGIAWANSSFDPAQDSIAHRIWQYAAPWVVGGMSFLGGPIGLFFGAMGGSTMAGFMTGVSMGAVLSGALLFVGCVGIFAIYSFRQYHDYRKLAIASSEDRDEMDPSAPNFDFSSSIVSLFWSLLQGLAIVGVLVLGVAQAKGIGLVLAMLWNLTLVISVMLFQLSVRGKVRRRSRFLFLLSTVAGGTMLGVILGSSLG